MQFRGIFAICAAICTMATLSWGADHLDAPDLEGNGQADINDIYAFQSPTNPANSVLIMTVNPFAGRVSPSDFATDVSYEFQLDNTGDAMADIVYRATFAGVGAEQTVSFMRGDNVLGSGAVGNGVPLSTGGMVQAGIFDDPFFFDLAGFRDGFRFTGVDAFAGANVSAIVMEVPSAELGGPAVGVWATTVRGGVQNDRMGRPAINTALIPSARKSEFNQGQPADDFAVFGDDVKTTITSLSNTANADALTPILLPDILTFDTSNASGFLNGRQLANDVIDAELNLLSAGGVTTDGVNGNDRAFRDVFPYLAEAHVVPEPSTVLLLVSGVMMFAGMRRTTRRR